MPEPLRFRLRSETRAAHERLDAKILHMFASDRGYGAYLRGALKARTELESLVFHPFSPVPTALITPISADLERDLRDIEPAALNTVGHVVTTTQPDEPGVWGVGYVLAGSALGAIRLREWADGLGFTATHGARHLANQVIGAGQWPRFVQAMHGFSMTDEEEHRCVEGAKMAFDIFDRAMEPLVDA
jgi:heme oxygenase